MRGLISGAMLALAIPGAAQAGSQPAPPRAQSPEAEVAAAMAKIFKVEALTAEQQARLPQAQALIAQIMPPGTLDQVMGGMFDKMLGPLMAMDIAPSSAQLARQLGVEDEDFTLSQADAEQVATLLDPVWKERRAREMAAVKDTTRKVMTMMEPAMRKGMAEAYAVTFTAPEMTDIAAFFSTPSGASFARKSYALASDPRILAASMEMIPTKMGQMKDIESAVEAATADLPAKKTFDTLSPAERAALSRLTGQSAAALRAGMERSARGLDES